MASDMFGFPQPRYGGTQLLAARNAKVPQVADGAARTYLECMIPGGMLYNSGVGHSFEIFTGPQNRPIQPDPGGAPYILRVDVGIGGGAFAAGTAPVFVLEMWQTLILNIAPTLAGVASFFIAGSSRTQVDVMTLANTAFGVTASTVQTTIPQSLEVSAPFGVVYQCPADGNTTLQFAHVWAIRMPWADALTPAHYGVS